MFAGLRIAASGLTAGRIRMDLTAQNLANVETTRTPDGGPYRRQFAVFAAVGDPAGLTGQTPAVFGGTRAAGSPAASTSPGTSPGGIELAAVREDTTPGPIVYDPGHPDADANGYVRMPNVDTTTEMLELMEARDAFDSNSTVFQAIRSMLQKSLSI